MIITTYCAYKIVDIKLLSFPVKEKDVFDAKWDDVIGGLKDPEMTLKGRTIVFEFCGQVDVKEM